MLLLHLASCLLVAVPPAVFYCDDDWECPGDETCDNGRCVPKECDLIEGGCPPGQHCDDDLCVPGCWRDEHCGPGDICDVLADECVECVFDFDCPGNQECRPNGTCR